MLPYKQISFEERSIKNVMFVSTASSLWFSFFFPTTLLLDAMLENEILCNACYVKIKFV